MAKQAFKKTNAMRILDSNCMAYKFYTYNVEEGKTDGVTVAFTIGKDPRRVFKTLVTQGTSKEHYVFVVPVEEELDLKKAAKAVGEKKIEMIPMKKLLPTTGYIHGGCSPIGMKKPFTTTIDQSAADGKTIICSGGRIGLQIEVAVDDLLELVKGNLADIT